MGTVNYNNPNLDLTVRVFDNFYKYDANVPAQEYDIVYSYFLTQMTTARAAGNFTSSLFRVAQETNIPVLTLLSQFQSGSQTTGSAGINLDVQMAYFMNQVRSRATLLGVSVPVTPNFYSVRNVVQ
jgi:pyruvate/2-oxoacid:ferredoxin oxidoreductase alpha subunit